jgi:hypothetical protein
MAGLLSSPHVPRIRRIGARCRAATPVFINHRRGDGYSRNRRFRAIRWIREADMNGHLPYRDSGPAARVGGVRGWQADILRGES